MNKGEGKVMIVEGDEGRKRSRTGLEGGDEEEANECRLTVRDA